MKILALESSSIACSVALQEGEKITALHKIAPMQQAKLILSMVNELLVTHSLDLQSLDAIAYGAGPGSFTGIRIASSVAQGLAYANQKPIISISSLAAMAQAAYEEQGWMSLLVAVDARMEQIYWARYEVRERQLVELIGEEKLIRPEHIKIEDSAKCYGIGDGWDQYRQKLLDCLPIAPLAIASSQLPTAHALLLLAKFKWEQGEWEGPFNAEPHYLR
ncbi:MAG: tRNA (adenosine(37)-N6)-threonylcarbamoyltransferase complex dimerization subunit type 1 TsaB [Gammaproteobacteria bacterium]|nr:tRNA (adenosine(37)-N6)-threonylcarbamoyltransferase complex dimerization subunit type 1 TsaB [Gammaproteobacteria bacterium]